MTKGAGLCAALVLLAATSAGCFAQPSDGLFGPAGSDVDGGVAVGTQGALSLRASPARGAAPLEVTFTLSMQGDDQEWTLDFGDRSPAATGKELPATVTHTYAKEGSYVAKFRPSGGDALAATVAILVLEPVLTGTSTSLPPEAPPTDEEEPAGPPPPGYAPPPPPPPPSSSSTTTSAGNGTSNATGSSSTSTTAAPSNSTSNSTSASTTSSASTSASDSGTPSESTSSSDTGSTSSTSTAAPPESSSQSQTSSEPPPPEPTSESSSSTDPPM